MRVRCFIRISKQNLFHEGCEEGSEEDEVDE